MSDGILDSPGACIAELSEINQEMAEFGHEWARSAGTLKKLERNYDRLFQHAMRTTEGRNAEERHAIAHEAVEKVASGLALRIESVDGEVEEYKTRFRALERRASIIQSILAAMREEAKIGNFVNG